MTKFGLKGHTNIHLLPARSTSHTIITISNIRLLSVQHYIQQFNKKNCYAALPKICNKQVQHKKEVKSKRSSENELCMSRNVAFILCMFEHCAFCLVSVISCCFLADSLTILVYFYD